jgi:hypothetical protein
MLIGVKSTKEWNVYKSTFLLQNVTSKDNIRSWLVTLI